MTNKKDIDLLIIIPAYNEENSILKVIHSLKEKGYTDILVIDDGSSDSTYNKIKDAGVLTARHSLNRGLGTALSTGFEIAKIIKPKIIVTFDADEQHDVNDIEHLIEPIKNGTADAVIGSRTSSGEGMPLIRHFYNGVANLVTFILYGFSASDTQSGFRAFSSKAYNLIDINTSKMECSSEIIYKIKKNRLRLGEIKIKPIYTEYSLSKGQNLVTGVKTFIRLVLNRMTGR